MTRITAQSRRPAIRIGVAAFVLLLAVAGHAPAQHDQHRPAPKREQAEPLGAPSPAASGFEPIRCWRQATAGAVSVGETFTVVLTCAVYEAENARVVPDESRLNVASIQMAPFEVLGGSHPPDVHRGPRRFLQYDYQVRIISPDAIGQDINIPPLTIPYRIHSRVGGAASLEGRDLSYLLPMMPIKVLSLVPNDATDIRDASDASLASIESLRFRSNMFRILTAAFGSLAVVMAALALVPLARREALRSGRDRGRVPARAVLHVASRELRDAQARASADRWTDETLAQALGAARLVAAAAIDRGISQRPLTGAVPEGRLSIRHGWARPVTTSVSSAVTADEVLRAAQGEGLPTARRQQLEALHGSLAAMSAALYAQHPARDATTLDEAVHQVLSVAGDLAREQRWRR